MNLTPEQEKRLLAAALRRKEALQRDRCIDPYKLDSRPAPHQEKVFAEINKYITRILTWGNQSGKSQTGGRDLAWVLEGKHPYFKAPKEWKGKPIGAIVMGRVGEQVETLLWREKIRPFLTPGTFKEVRSGNALQRVEAKDGSWTILLMSHHDANAAREKVQGFDYQYVWLDEMPNSVSLIAELQMRVIAHRGRMIVTFTPLIRNAEVKEWAENMDPSIGKLYRAGMLDNPVYKGREAEVIAMFKDLPEAERNTRLYGDWLIGSLAVYDFDTTRDLVPKPEGYNNMWPHLFSIDPASSGKSGYAMFSQRPSDKQWFLVDSGYIQEKVPTKLVEKAERECAGKNVIRRVSDSHETWFIQQAGELGYTYLTPWKKTERKDELIKQLQNVIFSKRVLFIEGQAEFTREASTCMYSDKSHDKIVNASSYHVLDAVQYGIDMIPRLDKAEIPVIDPDPMVQHGKEIRKQWAEVKKARALKAKLARSKRFTKGQQRWRA